MGTVQGIPSSHAIGTVQSMSCNSLSISFRIAKLSNIQTQQSEETFNMRLSIIQKTDMGSDNIAIHQQISSHA